LPSDVLNTPSDQDRRDGNTNHQPTNGQPKLWYLHKWIHGDFL
jgi:hypothetical protein